MVIRLSPYVYGNGGSVFIPLQLQAAKQLGAAYWVGNGNNKVNQATQEVACKSGIPHAVLALAVIVVGHVYSQYVITVPTHSNVGVLQIAAPR